MLMTACTVLLAAVVSSGSVAGPHSRERVVPGSAPESSLGAGAPAGTSAPVPGLPRLPAATEWRIDATPRRPAALPTLYVTFGALQVMDVYSTNRALGSGAREANPVLRAAGSRAGASIALKAVSSLTTIYFTERAWKKSPKGAVVLMAAINGVTAAVVARNMSHAR